MKLVFISSLEMSAQQLNDIARSHWGIENQLHWRLDVVFNEDKACIKNENAAENMNIMRKWALNSMSRVKQKAEQSIKGIMKKIRCLLSTLSQMSRKFFMRRPCLSLQLMCFLAFNGV